MYVAGAVGGERIRLRRGQCRQQARTDEEDVRGGSGDGGRVGGVACCPEPGADREARSGYEVPRTPWGDPDLQGKWPGTDMVGTPMQRDAKLGTRNVLTEAGVQAGAGAICPASRAGRGRLRSRALDGDTRWRCRRPRIAAAALAGTWQAAISGIAHRRSAGWPHAAADAASAAAAGRGARSARGPRAGRLIHGSQPVRPLHLARHRRVDPAGDLQQRQRDRSGARRSWRSATR